MLVIQSTQRVLNYLLRARLSRVSPPFPLSRQKAQMATHKKAEKEINLADERGGRRGVGEKPNHMTARKLVHYKSFNTLSVLPVLLNLKMS
jgi:hypothetical protein